MLLSMVEGAVREWGEQGLATSHLQMEQHQCQPPGYLDMNCGIVSVRRQSLSETPLLTA